VTFEQIDVLKMHITVAVAVNSAAQVGLDATAMISHTLVRQVTSKSGTNVFSSVFIMCYILLLFSFFVFFICTSCTIT